MVLIGITGGVGSGKSAVLDYLTKHYNVRTLMADRVTEQLEKKGGSLYEPILSLLETGSGKSRAELTLPDGEINRKEMAKLIFQDGELLSKVNALIHPAVREYIQSEVEKQRSAGAVDAFFLEAALLLECGYKEVVDQMWYIYCDEKERRKRLAASRGYTMEKVDAIMKSQLSEEAFRKGCDLEIDNTGDFEETKKKLDLEMQRLKVRPVRSCDFSRTETTHVLKYSDINGAGALFGGRLMGWIDETGGFAAMRHANRHVVTCCIDNLIFKEGAHLNDMIVNCARLTFVGRSSMEVRIDTYLEALDGTRRPINRAYAVYVAVDDDGKPLKVPYGLSRTTPNDEAEYEGALRRQEVRRRRRKEGF